MHAMDEISGRPARPLFSSRNRRRSSGPQVFALVLLIAAIGSGAAWYWLKVRPSGAAAPTEAAAEPAVGTPAVADDPLPPLPALAASDAVVRQLLVALSEHPQWAAWLVTDDLVRRFVKAVVDVGRGSSPVAHVDFLTPAEPFTSELSGGRLRIAPASYRRYDLLVETFTSLDTGAAARLYGHLHPLFEEAYAELGISTHTFDQMMGMAVQNLVAVRVPDAPPEITPHEAEYAFADPALERRTPAEKHVLRLGPENARRFQAKLSELAAAAGVALP